MKKPQWLLQETVLALQERLLAEFGGLSGLRDEGLLDSALHRPQQLFNYSAPTLCELAAAYSFGLIRNLRSWTVTSGLVSPPQFSFSKSMVGFSKAARPMRR